MSNEKIKARLKVRFKDSEYAHAYMETFFNAAIATQIKVLREQRGLTQGELAELTSMKQERISILENVDYGTWNVKTLRRLAEAFDLVLKVSFETFGEAINEVGSFSRQTLQRTPRAEELNASSSTPASVVRIAANACSASDSRFGQRVENSAGRSVLLQEAWLLTRTPVERQFDAEPLYPFNLQTKYSSTAAAMAMI